jgi:1,4-dihydroxy-2-naphthoyl-CoA synthase
MSRAFETLKLEVLDGTATLTFNRPDKRNALNLQMCLDLKDAAEAISGNADIRVVLVTARVRPSVPAPTSRSARARTRPGSASAANVPMPPMRRWLESRSR